MKEADKEVNKIKREFKILERVKDGIDRYNPDTFTSSDVEKALSRDRLDLYDFGALLSPAAETYLEHMATRAKVETARYFGGNVQLFTPLYLANYCENHCIYCGFSNTKSIRRARLSQEEIKEELAAIAKTGLDEILLLTGESREMSDVDYIGQAVKEAANYFGTIGLEVYPLDIEEYRYLHRLGADFVNVYQETYLPDIYDKVHPEGPKKDYAYRFGSQERALKGGMRGVSFGALLGLTDFRRDSFAAGIHAYFLQQAYPHGEIAFSVPRLRDTSVTEKQLLQIMLAYRIFLPFAGITISTRERAVFRDNVVGLCANKMSAGVLVGVGGHGLEQIGDIQFEVADSRSVSEIHKTLKDQGLQPVYSDYVRLD